MRLKVPKSQALLNSKVLILQMPFSVIAIYDFCRTLPLFTEKLAALLFQETICSNSWVSFT